MTIKSSLESGQLAHIVKGFEGGLAVEVNPIGDQKICSFDCSDCNLGQTVVRLSDLKKKEDWPTPEAIRQGFLSAASQLLQVETGTAPIHLIISGNGEPTLHPKFYEIAKALKNCSTELGQPVRLSLMTNGAHLGEKHVRGVISLIDEIFVKLEWCSDDQFQKEARPKIRIRLEDIVSLGATSKNISLQLVVKSTEWQTALRSQFDEWAELAQLIKPRRILLVPSIKTGHSPSQDELLILAHWIERKLQIKVLTVEEHGHANAA